MSCAATVLGHRQRSQLPRRRMRRRVTEGPRAGQQQLHFRPGAAVRRVPVLPAVPGPVAVPSHVHMRLVLREAGHVPDVPQSDQELLLRAHGGLSGRLRAGPGEDGRVGQATGVLPVGPRQYYRLSGPALGPVSTTPTPHPSH